MRKVLFIALCFGIFTMSVPVDVAYASPSKKAQDVQKKHKSVQQRKGSIRNNDNSTESSSGSSSVQSQREQVRQRIRDNR